MNTGVEIDHIWINDEFVIVPLNGEAWKSTDEILFDMSYFGMCAGCRKRVMAIRDRERAEYRLKPTITIKVDEEGCGRSYIIPWRSNMTYGDLLVWVDCVGHPQKKLIEKCRQGMHNQGTLLKTIKMPICM